MIDVGCVEERKLRKIRNTNIVLAWFASRSTFKIHQPPPLPAAREHDLFIHTYAPYKHQIWRLRTTQPPQWETIVEGASSLTPGDAENRVFVVTKQGQPAWVLPGTVGRLYKGVQIEGRNV